jgi:hypothetical protein
MRALYPSPASGGTSAALRPEPASRARRRRGGAPARAGDCPSRLEDHTRRSRAEDAAEEGRLGSTPARQRAAPPGRRNRNVRQGPAGRRPHHKRSTCPNSCRVFTMCLPPSERAVGAGGAWGGPAGVIAGLGWRGGHQPRGADLIRAADRTHPGAAPSPGAGRSARRGARRAKPRRGRPASKWSRGEEDRKGGGDCQGS